MNGNEMKEFEVRIWQQFFISALGGRSSIRGNSKDCVVAAMMDADESIIQLRKRNLL